MGSQKLTLPKAFGPLLPSKLCPLLWKMNSLLLWSNPHAGVLSVVKIKDLTEIFVLSLFGKSSLWQGPEAAVVWACHLAAPFRADWMLNGEHVPRTRVKLLATLYRWNNGLLSSSYRLPPLAKIRAFLWNVSKPKRVDSKEAVSYGHILLHTDAQNKSRWSTDACLANKPLEGCRWDADCSPSMAVPPLLLQVWLPLSQLSAKQRLNTSFAFHLFP